MKDIDETSYVMSIEIHRDMSKWSLGLSHKAYVEKIWDKGLCITLLKVINSTKNSIL